jgi:ADP-ribose pyrophosphatase
LRYAAHTLSFDARRSRGECDVAQLAYALESVDHLAMSLVSDLFHLRIRTERAHGYPPRQRIAIEEAPWAFPCPQYSPPYHVDPTVLANVRPNGWADPEDFTSILEELRARPAKFRDGDGRPLNPRGRTGIAGRGLLGLWGRNQAVAAVLVRPAGVAGALEVLLGREASQARIELPKGFLRPGEEPREGVARVVASEAGCRPDAKFELLGEVYTYDPRQTDHAWVETKVLLFFDAGGSLPDLPLAGGDFEEVAWQPLDAETINGVPSGQVGFLRAAIEHLGRTTRLEPAAADSLLASTG